MMITLRQLLTVGALLVLTNSQSVSIGARPVAPTTYYVDFEHGNDQNNGTNPQQSWKHSPGDPTAKGRPLATQLKPGDRVAFASGVTYRGTIIASASGSREAPIIYEGVGTNPAIISGSDPLEVIACDKNPVCQGVPKGAVLLKVDREAALRGTIFDGLGPMRLAQSPNPRLADYPDEPDDFLSIPTTEIQQGQLTLPEQVPDCAQACGGELAIWVKPNVVVTRPIAAIANSTASFDPGGLKFYTDRNTRYAVRGPKAFLDQPGEYVSISDNYVLALPRDPNTCCFLASGRGGIKISNASWITVRNLTFEKMADGNGFGKGIAIFANTPGISGIRIEGNTFRNFDLRSGSGAINMSKINDLKIVGNRISLIVRGSGMRIAGPSSQTLISRNLIERIGRTAIYVSGASDVEVADNVISDVRGVHGNGLTAYLGHQRVTFRHNTVIDAKQPLTFHGTGTASNTPNNLTIEENLLFATPDSLGALISWGKNTRDVTISGNILLGGRFGLRMSRNDTGVIVRKNLGTPPAPTAPVFERGGADANHWWTGQRKWESELLEIVRQHGKLTQAQQSRFCKEIFGRSATGKVIGATLTCP